MSEYRCPVCTFKLEPYGTAGMVCPQGHHFMAADIKRSRPKVTKVAGNTVDVAPWVPGAVLGGLALLAEAVRVVVEGVT